MDVTIIVVMNQKGFLEKSEPELEQGGGESFIKEKESYEQRPGSSGTGGVLQVGVGAAGRRQLTRLECPVEKSQPMGHTRVPAKSGSLSKIAQMTLKL